MSGSPRGRFDVTDWGLLGASGLLAVSLPVVTITAASSAKWPPGLPAATVVAGLTTLLLLGLALRRSRGLNSALNALSEELELRVARRTEELAKRTAELTTMTEHWEALNRVAASLSLCATSSEVLSSGLGQVGDTFGLRAGAVWLRGTEGEFDLVAYRGPFGPLESLLAELARHSSALDGALQRELPTPLVGDDLHLHLPTLSDDSAPHALSSLLVIPLVSRGAVLGGIGLVGPAGRSWSESELSLAQALGAQVGIALENARRYEEARNLADRDPVTGLLNHRALHQRLDQELRRAQRAGQRFSVVMMDLDGFKLFNDTYGHPVGDRVLRTVARLLTESVRGSDLLGRYGGDEFMAILPNTDAEGAVVLAERVRAALAEHPYEAADGGTVPIRMSFGVAAYPDNARKIHELVGFADANLYESKQRGGDVVTVGDSRDADDVARTGSFGVLDGLVRAVDNKDHYTCQHSEDVAEYALSIAQAMGLSGESLRTLRTAALLHDVGKIGIPDRILRKPARLDRDESSIVRQHALLGEMIIKDVPNIGDVLAAVGSHHERFDGRGYPRGLRGDQIPLLGRILAVADAYSAMTTDRPYRKGRSPKAALAELRRVAGTQLDPEVVGVFLGLPLVRDLVEREEVVSAAS